MTLAVFVVFLLLATAGVLAQGGDKQIIIDPCSGYCLNGGTCSDTGNGPVCSCPRGFSGTKCEIHPGTCPVPGDVSVCGGVPCATDVQCEFGQKCCELACGGTWCTPVASRDPCIPDPFVCKNGGTCTSPLDFVICQCRSGFGGPYCENPVPVKSGTCVADQNAEEFNCTRGCDNDFDCPGTQKCCNTQCERQCSSRIIIDPCSGYCLNGGTCSDPGNGPVCSCPRGFSGTKCEIHPGTCPIVKPDDVSVCGGVPCATDVQCEFGQKCCELACGGTWCTPVASRDPCIPDPFVCKNGGTCTSPLDFVICQCRSGFGGPRCENPVPVKIGTCVADPNAEEFNCTRGCDNDFDCPGTQKCCNTQCERQCSSRIIIDPCSGYCLNGGTCSDPGNGPVCSCPQGFSGTKCEIHPGTCPVPGPGDVTRCGVVPCETDVQCKLDQKCCPLDCRGTWCITPVTIFDRCRDYCLNGGTCSAPADAPICTCPRGFSGPKCEIYNPPGTCPKARDASACGGVPCRTHNQCKAGQKCCALRCGKKYCTPDVYPPPTPTPPPLTCLTVKCTANVVCRHIVDCDTCPIHPKCIPTSNLPKDIDSKCQLGGYSEAILIQSPTSSSSYSPLLCGGPADVSTYTCPSDSVCVGRGYGGSNCCRGLIE